jgi:hypothetical protein
MDSLREIYEFLADIVPDAAMLLLTIAGINLMPGFYRSLEEKKGLRKAMTATFIILGVAGIVLNHLSRADFKRQMEDLPGKVAEYSQHIAPPNSESSVIHVRPSKHHFTVNENLEFSEKLTSLNAELLEFSKHYELMPSRRKGESIDKFLTRSNSFYEGFQKDYESTLRPRVLQATAELERRGIAIDILDEYAAHPRNPVGIGVIVEYLLAADKKLLEPILKRPL